MTSNLLVIDQVSAGYDRVMVLSDISLKIGGAELVALFGSNGAGKSTLLKAIMGLANVGQGTIHLSGENVTHRPTHERANAGIGYLLQESAVFSSLTVHENLALPARRLDAGGRNGAIDRCLDEFPILAHLQESQAGLLSGGERKLLALAMVVIAEPRVLLLDEPCAGLSPTQSADVLELIRSLTSTRGLATLLVEHRVNDVLGIADRAILLQRGRIQACTLEPARWASGQTLGHLVFGTQENAEGRFEDGAR